jgi:DNA-binding IclR family transcriptional regulator
VSVGETLRGAVSVAVPTPWLYEGMAAFGIAAPAARFGPRERAAAARTLLEEMDRLHRALGR